MIKAKYRHKLSQEYEENILTKDGERQKTIRKLIYEGISHLTSTIYTEEELSHLLKQRAFSKTENNKLNICQGEDKPHISTDIMYSHFHILSEGYINEKIKIEFLYSKFKHNLTFLQILNISASFHPPSGEIDNPEISHTTYKLDYTGLVTNCAHLN
jgi:hypothetical protein